MVVKEYESPPDYSDPAAYWNKIGTIYKSICDEEAETYQRQLKLLGQYVGPLIHNQYVKVSTIKLSLRVLEIGPGYGRITKFMLANYGRYIQKYHAMDISIPMIHSLLNHLEGTITTEKGARFQIRHFDISDQFTVHDFIESLPFQEVYNYDFIFSVECLMHIRPESIKQAIKNIASLLRRGGHLITLDFFVNGGVGYALSPENFLHNYPGLFSEAGLEFVSVIKLEGQDQSLIHFTKSTTNELTNRGPSRIYDTPVKS